MTPAETGALAGVRVLELGRLVSAPYATKLLSDLGADVIKVEPPEGESARHRGPWAPGREGDPDASGLYLALNTGKRSVVIEPGSPGAGGRLGPLVAEADMVVTNLSPGDLTSFGFDADAARAVRPELVVCSITPFGLTGPKAGWAAEELTVSHAGGWAYQTPGASVEVDRPPLKVFGHQTGFHAGTTAATVGLAALHKARRTGVGDHIDLSSVAHVAGMLEAALIAASYTGENPNRLGSRLLNPWKIFECRPPEGGVDPELLFLVCVEPDQWLRLVELMGHPDWVDTGLFDTVEQRLANDDLLALYVEEWTRTQPMAELWHRGQDARVCTAPVLTMADMADQEHLAARGFFTDVDHPAAGTVRHLDAPFRAGDGFRPPLRPAPLLDRASAPRFAPVGTARSGAGGTGAVTPARRPLEGVRVLDLSWVWAGPYCGLHLAALGAEVIEVESARRPGLGRRLNLHPPDVEPSLNTCCYYNQWEQGRLSVLLDLARPASIELVKRLAAHCDVVVENFANGVMEKLGLGYETLAGADPGIIMASISGYGATGPLRSYMGYGPTTGPLSGLSALTGHEGGPPRELGVAVGDPAAGITAAFAVCAALTERERTGRGRHLDVSLWEATTSFAVEGWMAHALTGSTPPRMGNRDPLLAPHNCYRTAPEPGDDRLDPDPGRWLSIACPDDASWRALAGVVGPDLGLAGLADDPRFARAADRKANEDELDRLLARWAATRDRWELTGRLQAVGVAAHPSLSPLELLADEHLEARGFFERHDHPEVGRRTHTGLAWRSATSPHGMTRRAPLIGEHTDEVLTGLLGLPPAEIAALRDDGVVA
jgi:crotonobetainyl-CoA:carnitine CoA-transferase CaiB-like acyl-CoA transferase